MDSPQPGAKPEARRGHDPSIPEDRGRSRPPPAMRRFGRSLTRLLPLDLPPPPAGAAVRPRLRQHRRDRAGRAAGAPLPPRSASTAPPAGALLGRRGALTPLSGDTRGSRPEPALLSGRDTRGDPGAGRYSRRRAGGRAAPGHGGSAGGAAERPRRL